MSDDSGNVQPEDDNGTRELPPFNQRFERLKPSRELLEFYRHKISEYDTEYQQLFKKLENYEYAQKELEKCHWENRQHEDEIKQLQQALSDMQVYLFQEREHVLRLYAENDRLKIRELEMRKKIQHLLTLPPQSGGGETTYMFKEPRSKVLIQQHRPRAEPHDPVPISSGGRGPGGHKKPPGKDKGVVKVSDDDGDEVPDTESMLLTVEALSAQLQEQTKLCKEQVDALLEDRRVRTQEFDVAHKRDADKIGNLSEQLTHTQSLLYESTKDFLQLKYAHRAKERDWMAERDQLLNDMDKMREQLSSSAGNDSLLDFSCFEDMVPPATLTSKASAVNIRQLQIQSQQTQQLADWYREQCIKQEDELARLKEECELSKNLFKERTEKVTKRLGLVNNRYEALEKRRALEVEGYKTDIKILRERLKDLEKRLCKLTTTLSASNDIEVLAHVRQTALTSKKLMDELQQMKSKMYSMENKYRHIHDH